MKQKIEVGDRIEDRDGIRGTVIEITDWRGSRWYTVRFPRGEAVRYPDELTVLR